MIITFRNPSAGIASAGSTTNLRARTQAAIDDGRAYLTITALGLVAAGLTCLVLAISGQLLPQDVAFLSIPTAFLCTIADGRVVQFMVHDRAAFGGTLLAVGVLYTWLIASPLARGEAWAWWLLAASGALGFLSFLSYLGTGYLDTWHGVATLGLLVPFLLGMARSRRLIAIDQRPRAPLRPRVRLDLRSADGIGRTLLLLTAIGLLGAGLIIVTIGTFVVFVPQDVTYLGLDRVALDRIDPHLVPLIAHDRAGFGGSLATTGLAVLGCVWCGRPSRSLWLALLLAGVAGFGAAIGVHVAIGYLDVMHAGPAVLGAAAFVLGIVLTRSFRA